MSVMIRGTTPTITFNLPFQANLITNCEVYFAQDGVMKVVKYKDACEMSGKTLSVKLSQAETLLLDPEIQVEMQVRMVFEDGSVEATNIVRGNVGRILKGGEIDVSG